MIGRELDVLWSGEPDLRIEELGMAGNGWERLGTAGNGWEVVQVAPCGAKQILFFLLQWFNPSDPQESSQIQILFFVIHLYSSGRRTA